MIRKSKKAMSTNFPSSKLDQIMGLKKLLPTHADYSLNSQVRLNNTVSYQYRYMHSDLQLSTTSSMEMSQVINTLESKDDMYSLEYLLRRHNKHCDELCKS
ncbi:hypothetical protein RND81_14G130700 [Saponaria officinalis]|uniref:Uncharacterized protein n=1 Tax=Saponaria officinalis TaxID=3572 RepID=A0AAW1GTG9_SAPOF